MEAFPTTSLSGLDLPHALNNVQGGTLSLGTRGALVTRLSVCFGNLSPRIAMTFSSLTSFS